METSLNVQPPRLDIWKHILAIAALIVIVVFMFGCKSAARLERKELEPYNKVNNDVSGLFVEKKLELGANYCNNHFPIKIQTIVHDSIHQVTVKDTTELSELKALLKKSCPTLNIDSILIENMLIDTVYIDRYHKEVTTAKDTVGNFRKQVEYDNCKQSLITLQSNLSVANEKVLEYAANEKKGSYIFKLIWNKYWWVFLIIGALIGFAIAWKLLKNQYLPKI